MNDAERWAQADLMDREQKAALKRKVLARAALFPTRNYFLVSQVLYMELLAGEGEHPVLVEVVKNPGTGRLSYTGLKLSDKVTVFPERVLGEQMSELDVKPW